MKQEDNKEFNAAYDLIHQNSIKIPDKIAFIDDDQTIDYSNPVSYTHLTLPTIAKV